MIGAREGNGDVFVSVLDKVEELRILEGIFCSSIVLRPYNPESSHTDFHGVLVGAGVDGTIRTSEGKRASKSVVLHSR
jgi:hypothetical protein